MVLLCSLIGYGRMILLTSRSRVAKSLSIEISVGLSLFVFMGGVLNLFQMIHAWSISAIIVIGLALYFLSLKKSTSENCLSGFVEFLCSQSRLKQLLYSFLLLPFLFLFIAGIFHSYALSGDDLSSYLYFLERIKQTGEIGSDPFNANRLMTSLGGFYFLQSYFYFILGKYHLWITDHALGSFLLIVAIFDFCRELSIQKRYWPVAALSVFVFPISYNSQSYYLTMFLYLCLIRLLYFLVNSKESWRVSDLLSCSLVLASISSLKSTGIPPVWAMGFLFLFWDTAIHKNHVRFIKGLAVIVISLSFLSPWMLSMFFSSGTLLYPLLGTGFADQTYDPVLQTFSEKPGFMELFKIVLLQPNMYNALLLLFLFLISRRFQLSLKILFSLLMLIAFLNTMLIMYYTGDATVNIYRAPFFHSVFAIILVLLLNFKSEGTDVWVIPGAVAAAMTLYLMNYNLYAYGNILVFLIVFLNLLFYCRPKVKWVLACALLLMTVSILLFVDLNYIVRRSYVFLILTVIFLLFKYGIRKNMSFQFDQISIGIVIFVFIFQININGGHVERGMMNLKENILFEKNRSVAQQFKKYKEEFVRVQDMIPGWESVLICTHYSFLLDMNKNMIHYYYTPGGSSLPPGAPLSKGASEFKEYLKNCGIKYILMTERHDFLENMDYITNAPDKKNLYSYSLGKYMEFKEIIEKFKIDSELLYENDLVCLLKLY